jgi:ABC-type uncharacterized transport system involved in gliding motility auxiliary subunit
MPYVAYQDTIFGKAAISNNSDFLLNAIEFLGGSGELIAIRSRGNFRRPFDVVEEIKDEAEKKTAVEIAKRNAEIKALQKELDDIVASAEGSEENIIAEEVEKKRRQAAIKLRQAQRDLNDIQRKRFVEIEQLRSLLQNINTWSAPVVILIIAVFLSIRRSVLRRRYVSHASDA